jgi:hypothetical protein
MPYHQLIYTSRPTIAITEDSLVEMLNAAQIKNAKLGITGLLALHEGNFIQLLEGQEENVRSLYDAIKSDPRHTDLKIELESETALRAVPSWNMGFTTSYDLGSKIASQSYFFPLDFVKGLCKMMSGNVDKKLLHLLEG